MNSQATSNYYESNFVSRRWRRSLAKMVGGLLPEGWEGQKLLDVGTGDGYTIRLVKPVGEVVGVDMDPSMGPLAKAKSVAFRHGSAYSVPFDSESFDLVTCIEVVEHLERPAEALREIARVLKPGGSAVMTTPVPSLRWRLLWWGWTKFGPGKRWDTTPHVTDLHLEDEGDSSPGLLTVLKQMGFEVEATAKCNMGMVVGVRAKKQGPK